MLCETERQEQWQQQRNRMEKTGKRFTITINCVHVLSEKKCVQTLDSKLKKTLQGSLWSYLDWAAGTLMF